jgi:hypothetical protein
LRIFNFRPIAIAELTAWSITNMTGWGSNGFNDIRIGSAGLGHRIVNFTNGQTAALNGQTAALNGQTAALNGQTAALNGQIAALNGQIAPLNGQISRLDRCGRNLGIGPGMPVLERIFAHSYKPSLRAPGWVPFSR